MNRWFQILFLSFVMLAVLRSLLEPGVSSKKDSYWNDTESQLRMFENNRSQAVNDRIQLAEALILNNKIYDASLIYHPLWKVTPGQEGKYDPVFVKNANRLAEIYLLEGHFGRSLKCYQSILDYDIGAKGEKSATVTRDKNNMGVAYYLAAETSQDKEVKKRSYARAMNLLDAARKNLSSKQPDYDTNNGIIRQNQYLVARDCNF